MCGIYGQIEKFSEAQLAFLDRQLFHRGPDERRWKEFSHIHLFHARLSIVDASGGAQPMETERYAIIFNGEIYNHLELRSQFGLQAKTRSDTETLLLLYEKLGVDMLSYLDGMFSFAIYNKQTKEVVLCRDRMGEKPFYYLHDEKGFCFGSELNTLAGLRELNIRPEAQVQFLVCGWVGPEETIYENVFHVLPGHYVRVTQDPTGRLTFKSQCWWSYRNLLLHTPKKSNENALTEELLELLKVSVKRRVESSDLPVGCFLSGGLDSSIVTTMASFIKAPLPTYTFIFDEEYNEGPIAAELSRIVQTRHEEIHVNYDHICDDIGNILLAYGEPFCDDSAIPSYYIAREAKKLNTVIINGDGGDELFGGYRRYVPLAWPSSLQRIIRGVSKAFFPFLPAPQKKIDGYNYIHRLAQLSTLVYPEKYLSLTTNLFKKDGFYAPASKAYVPQTKRWIEEQFNQRFDREGASFPQSNEEGISKHGHSLSEMRQCMLADIQSLLPVVLLKKVDISTMQSSLESRTVFFTPEILQFAASLPDRLLISGTTTKVLLRKFAQKYLPANIFKQPKRGFELPLIHFMNGKLKEIAYDHLMSENAFIHSIIPRAELESILYRKEPLSEDRRSKMLYTLFVLEYWMKHRSSASKSTC